MGRPAVPAGTPDAATAIRGAFDEDLNTAALDLLRSTESRRDIPAGTKFETFLFVDRVLGLELPARDRPLIGEDQNQVYRGHEQ